MIILSDQEELDKWNVEQKDLLAQMEQAYVDILTDNPEEYNRSITKKGELIQLKQKRLKLAPKIQLMTTYNFVIIYI